MDVPVEAIEAAREGLKEWDILTAKGRDDFARTALSAAMPAIREAIAQEIEAIIAVTDHPDGSFSGTIYHAQYTHGIEDAAAIVRGGTP